MAEFGSKRKNADVTFFSRCEMRRLNDELRLFWKSVRQNARRNKPMRNKRERREKRARENLHVGSRSSIFDTITIWLRTEKLCDQNQARSKESFRFPVPRQARMWRKIGGRLRSGTMRLSRSFKLCEFLRRKCATRRKEKLRPLPLSKHGYNSTRIQLYEDSPCTRVGSVPPVKGVS